MLFLGKTPDSTLELIERLDLLSERLLQGLSIPTQAKTLSSQDQVFTSLSNEQLAIVRSGTVTLVQDGRELLTLMSGDLIGLSRVFGLPHGEFKIEDDVELDVINRDDFMAYVHGDAQRQHRFCNYLLTYGAILESLLIHGFNKRSQSSTGFQHVKSGTVIIKEGHFADTVYQLMTGSADVSVNGAKVGEVLAGEIFGAMAVFTGEKRNATVVAREDSQLLAIPKAQFVNLIKAEPEIAISLLDSMSRRINSLNDQVSSVRLESV